MAYGNDVSEQHHYNTNMMGVVLFYCIFFVYFVSKLEFVATFFDEKHHQLPIAVSNAAIGRDTSEFYRFEVINVLLRIREKCKFPSISFLRKS